MHQSNLIPLYLKRAPRIDPVYAFMIFALSKKKNLVLILFPTISLFLQHETKIIRVQNYFDHLEFKVWFTCFKARISFSTNQTIQKRLKTGIYF